MGDNSLHSLLSDVQWSRWTATCGEGARRRRWAGDERPQQRQQQQQQRKDLASDDLAGRGPRTFLEGAREKK